MKRVYIIQEIGEEKELESKRIEYKSGVDELPHRTTKRYD